GRHGICAHDGGPCTEPGERLPRPQLGWVADPAHLADEPIDVRPSRQPGHRPLHVVRDLAADTPVRQLEGVRPGRPDERGIDVDLTEVIHDHGGPPRPGRGQEPVDERRLSAAQVAAHQRDRLRRDGLGPGTHRRGPLTRVLAPASVVGSDAGTHGACTVLAQCWPPTTVPWTRMAPRASGATASGSSARTARSAYLPGSIEPISASRLSMYALPIVTAASAVSASMRSCSPMTRPDRVRRVTACIADASGPSGVTGESECRLIGTPLRIAVAAALFRRARSGPIVRSRCWSPHWKMWLEKMFAHAPSAAI